MSYPDESVTYWIVKDSRTYAPDRPPSLDYWGPYDSFIQARKSGRDKDGATIVMFYPTGSTQPAVTLPATQPSWYDSLTAVGKRIYDKAGMRAIAGATTDVPSGWQAVNGERVQIHPLANVYSGQIGDDTKVGAFVEIQAGAVIGARCKIESHAFICDGVTIEDEVFVGHHAVFTNDRYPQATNDDGTMVGPGDWTMEHILVRRGASIGSGAIILPSVTVGEGAFVGAGAIVTKDVMPGAVVRGKPAK